MVSQTIFGIIIGVISSLIAGMFLIWKGEQLIHFLRRLPDKRRAAIFCRAYLLALKSYPYHYAHLLILQAWGGLLLTLLMSYVIITYLAFNLDFSSTPEKLKESFQLLFEPTSSIIFTVYNPWVLLSITIILIYICVRIAFKTIPPHLLVPYAHRELVRIRECIDKCATKSEFLEYTDAEYNVDSAEDFIALLLLAKKIIGDSELKLITEILESISPTSQEKNNDSNSQKRGEHNVG